MYTRDRGGAPAWTLDQAVNQARRRRAVLATSMEMKGLKGAYNNALGQMRCHGSLESSKWYSEITVDFLIYNLSLKQ